MGDRDRERQARVGFGFEPGAAQATGGFLPFSSLGFPHWLNEGRDEVQFLSDPIFTALRSNRLPQDDFAPFHPGYMLTFQRVLEVLLPSPLGSSRLLSPTPDRRPTRGRAASGACTEWWGGGGGLAAGNAQDLGTSSPPLFPKLGWKRLGHTPSPEGLPLSPALSSCPGNRVSSP